MPCAITFDTDWAPDWCIRDCFELCRDAGVGATFFATNPSSVLEEIVADPRFEVGIHPNFFSDTTQILTHYSDTARERIRTEDMTRIAAVLEYCIAVVPHAQSMRTHGLWQCSRMFLHIENNHPNIKYDVSTFMQNAHAAFPWKTSFAQTSTHQIMHIPYTFDDSVFHTHNTYRSQLSQLSQQGTDTLHIYNFHPIHIALNSFCDEKYVLFKHANPRSNTVTRDCVEKFKNTTHKGSRTLLEECLTRLPFPQTIASLAGHYEHP